MLSTAPKRGPDGQLQLHASTVVINGSALAIVGPSGSGKSGFALGLMSRGADLLADDITWFTRDAETVVAQCPPTLSGKIEARGVGILNAVPTGPAPLRAIVDLGRPETERLPVQKSVELLGVSVRVFHTPAITHFFDAIFHYMSHHTPS